jgi:predicted nucleic acid-binding protein
MKHLLDVNVLLAAIWVEHPHHNRAFSWLAGKDIVLCPLCELGFLRISSNKNAINAPMEKARDLLEKFAEERKVERIHDDLTPLDSHPKTSQEVTDCYLADLSAPCQEYTVSRPREHTRPQQMLYLKFASSMAQLTDRKLSRSHG